MAAYYNEFDPFAAAWLRELIKDGLIADGEVDERSIKDVVGADLARFTQCHFFAGIGGWSHALRLAGWSDTRPVWTGSCPCQPFSGANKDGRGEADERHLWPDFFRLIKECRPSTVFGEQVTSGGGPQWLTGVRADLEAAGFAFGAANIPAGGVGSPQKRERFWFVAMGVTEGVGRGERFQPLQSADRRGQDGGQSPWSDARALGADGRCRRAVPGTPVMAHGLSNRMDQLRCIGNAIVPQVGAVFIAAADEAMTLSLQPVT